MVKSNALLVEVVTDRLPRSVSADRRSGFGRRPEPEDVHRHGAEQTTPVDAVPLVADGSTVSGSPIFSPSNRDGKGR